MINYCFNLEWIKKRLLTIILALVVLSPLFAESAVLISQEVLIESIPEEATVIDLSVILGIPASKLIELLELEPETKLTSTISELNISDEQIKWVQQRFKNKLWGYSWSIVLIGMVVIFLSLSLTGFLISQLRHVAAQTDNKKEKKQIIPRLQNVKYRDTSYNSVIAAITALHLHLQEAEESSKMTIAWSREPVSVWKTSSKFNMPNRALRAMKRR